jgi:hypothetical protein
MSNFIAKVLFWESCLCAKMRAVTTCSLSFSAISQKENAALFNVLMMHKAKDKKHQDNKQHNKYCQGRY